MKILKPIILSMLFIFASYQAQACCSAGISISGPTTVCSGLTQTYTIPISCSIFSDISVVGGTINSFVSTPTSATLTSVSSTNFTISGIHNLTLTVSITWNSSGTRRLIAEANSGTGSGPEASATLNFSTASASFSGPDGPLCNTTSSVDYYHGALPPGGSRMWSVNYTSGIPAPQLSTTTGAYLTVSNLQPINQYFIDLDIICSGSVVASSSKWMTTYLPSPCTPPVAPGAGPEVEVEQINPAHSDLETVRYLETEDGLIKLDRNDDRWAAESKINAVQVYPNPVSHNQQLVIELPVSKSAYSIQVVDAQGRVLQSAQTNELRLQVSTKDFPKGIYTVNISSDDLIVNKRIVVQ